MFKEERRKTMFNWSMLGDVGVGRPNLGEEVPVVVYRLMQFTLRDQMIQQFGVEATDRLFYEAGRKAGIEFHENLLNKHVDFNHFVDDTQAVMKNLGIGILRVEKADLESREFVVTVAEDLDCSGLPITDEEICVYDEGFIAGLLYNQTNTHFQVKEIDCWCSGDRVCRFDIKPMEK